MLEVVYPFLDKIGVLWLTNKITPAQEHFISNLIRQKLIVAIDNLPLPSKDSRKAVLFLPENELHEIALLFYYFICKKEGIYTYYLGQTVPYSSLKSVCEECQPEIIVSSFTSQPSAYAVQNFVNKMAEDFSSAKIFLSGYAFSKTKVNVPANVTLFEKALILKELLMFNVLK
jgi:methanogenic corrinoid protein MtbC1